jgi:hypothetical protein
MSCECQGCGYPYKVDIIVPDELWERIKPPNKALGGGLLCGKCIGARVEAISGYECYRLDPQVGDRKE